MKFNKNEFGWKEKVSINTDELVTKNDIPHYNETLMFEISGEDYRFFLNNNYFNMSALNIDETKLYTVKDISDEGEYTFEFVYDKELDALMNGDYGTCIYNHKSYNGENFIEDENSAVITLGITTFDIEESEINRYFRLYEIDKLELDSNCLPKDVNIPNSLTVGTRIGDIGEFSVTEGEETTASGSCSHAEGVYTTASGNISHAEGYKTIASGTNSHAEGRGTEASSDYQHVQGKYNIEDTENTYAHIVGNGTSDGARSNAHTLDWQGNGWYKGKLSQDGTPTEDKDLTTKKYVDDKAIVEQIPILRVNEDNKIIYVNCNEMGTYKKYFVPNKYANVYSFSFVYTNDDNTETEIVRVGGALTRDDFVLCSRNTSSQLILVLGNTDKYTYVKSTKTIATGLNGYLKTGNTQEYTPTSDYNPATKKYVDDAIANQPTFSFNDSGELVVTINGVTKTFVPKQ